MRSNFSVEETLSKIDIEILRLQPILDDLSLGGKYFKCFVTCLVAKLVTLREKLPVLLDIYKNKDGVEYLRDTVVDLEITCTNLDELSKKVFEAYQCEDDKRIIVFDSDIGNYRDTPIAVWTTPIVYLKILIGELLESIREGWL